MTQPIARLVLQYFWLISLIVALLNAAIWWWRGRGLEPERKLRHRQLVFALALCLSLPWIVAGLYQLLGQTKSILDYFEPRAFNPYVWSWYGLVIVLNSSIAIWLLRGGANEMADLPPLGATRLPSFVWRLFALGMVIAPLTFIALAWNMDLDLSRFAFPDS